MEIEDRGQAGAVTHYIFHSIATNSELDGDLTYETSRLNFIGRNRNLKNPELWIMMLHFKIQLEQY